MAVKFKDINLEHDEIEVVKNQLASGTYNVPINGITAEFLGDPFARYVLFNEVKGFHTDTGVTVDPVVWHTLDPYTMLGAAGGEAPVPPEKLKEIIWAYARDKNGRFIPFSLNQEKWTIKLKKSISKKDYESLSKLLPQYTITMPSSVARKVAAIGIIAGFGAGVYLTPKLIGDNDHDGKINIRDPHPDVHEDKLIDHDRDGLNKYDEEHIYHTDDSNIDTDWDYVRDDIEIAKGTDPTQIYSFGSKIDDFNRLFTYPDYLNPDNVNRDDAFLKMIPNVKAKEWKSDEGGVSFKQSTQRVARVLEISEKDPLIRYLVENTEIRWSDEDHAQVFVDGEPIWKEYKERSGVNPSFYFTNGRYGNCGDSSLVNFNLLKLRGDKPQGVSGIDEYGQYNSDYKGCGHGWVEFEKGGQKYVLNFNSVMPAEEWYGKIKWKDVRVSLV